MREKFGGKEEGGQEEIGNVGAGAYWDGMIMEFQRNYGQVAQLVERSPEKAGVGGSIPSLATSFSVTYKHPKTQFHSISFQNYGSTSLPSWDRSVSWGCFWLRSSERI
jgi:hypothetical protein